MSPVAKRFSVLLAIASIAALALAGSAQAALSVTPTRTFGKVLKPGEGCTASKSVKVTVKSVFRAVLIGGSNHATLGYSPNLTVKLK